MLVLVCNTQLLTLWQLGCVCLATASGTDRERERERQQWRERERESEKDTKRGAKARPFIATAKSKSFFLRLDVRFERASNLHAHT